MELNIVYIEFAKQAVSQLPWGHIVRLIQTINGIIVLIEIPMLARMYQKRLRKYQAMGYNIKNS